MSELTEQIKVVAEARQKAQEAKDVVNGFRELWETQNRAVIDKAILFAQQTIDAETKLRELTLQAYAETGNKASAEGVGIRDITTYSYDGAKALAWAIEHKLALKLDEPAFKKIAKASPLPFVTSITEPQATIATNLNEFLKEVE